MNTKTRSGLAPIYHEQAQKLYEVDIPMSWERTLKVWATVFTREQLVALWETIDLSLHPYDDEVHDALYVLGYFD